MASDKSLSGLESFVYYLFVFLTLGGVFLYKVIIKKALIESK